MYQSIVTVTSAASSYALLELDTAKEELGITDTASDAMLTRWIGEESARAADFCRRVFPVETISETFRRGGYHGWFYRPAWPMRRHDGLILARRPVVSITSITEDGTALTTDDYETDTGAGIVYRLRSGHRSAWYAQEVVVAYQAGFATIPADVSQACLTLIKHRWAARTRDPALRSIQIQDVGQKTFWVGSAGDVGDMPPEVEAALARYQEYSV